MPRQPTPWPITRTGTTTIGMVCEDGVILAAERRATIGSMIASKTDRKVYRLEEHLGITTAGDVGDAQTLVRYLQAEIALRQVRTYKRISVRAAATFASNLLARTRLFPYLVSLIIGGRDDSGPHIYALDLGGGLLEDKYAVDGTGAPVALGVLEDAYRPGLAIDAGLDVTLRALHAATERDIMSGDGYMIATIGPRGFELLEDAEITRRLTKLKLT